MFNYHSHPSPPSLRPPCPLPRLIPLSLTPKSPLVSPQIPLPTPCGSPTLAASSCQDSSICDTLPVGPSLGTTYRRTRILPFSGHSFRLSYVSLPLFCPRTPALHLLVDFFHLAIGRRTTPLPLLAPRLTYLYSIPLAWFGQAGNHNSPLSVPLRLRASASNFLHPSRIPQPCRWSHKCPSWFAFTFAIVQRHSIGSRGAISFPLPPSLSFAPSPSPSGTRTRFGDLSPNSQQCGLTTCDTIDNASVT